MKRRGRDVLVLIYGHERWSDWRLNCRSGYNSILCRLDIFPPPPPLAPSLGDAIPAGLASLRKRPLVAQKKEDEPLAIKMEINSFHGEYIEADESTLRPCRES